MEVTDVLVTGGTGKLGTQVAERLRAGGFRPRVMSRSGKPGTVKGNLLTGEGLREAVTGTDAIIHAAQNPMRKTRETFVRGTERLLRAAEEAGYCGGCGKKMQYSASPAKGRIYSYYKCRRVLRDGRDACPAGADRPNHRAKELEQRVWEFVFELMKSPERLREDLERMIEIEREGRRGDPELEAKAWLEKLAEVDQERRGYLRLAAKGHMTDEDLDRELGELEETRRTAERELESIKNRQERVELLERDKDEVLDSYARLAPEALDGLSPEERHRLYRMLRLKVILNPDRSLEVSGALETELVQSGFVQPETVPR